MARVKRRGKSPPPKAQALGQEKPYVVQDRTGEQVAGLENSLLHEKKLRVCRTSLLRSTYKQSERNDHPSEVYFT